MFDRLKASETYLRSITNTRPSVGLILGSGLGSFVETIEDAKRIAYAEIPFFPQTTIEGHEGRMIVGKVGGVPIAVLQGRVHAYEGVTMDDVVFPTRVLAMLGVESLILTNAAGGINGEFAAGDLVLITDHINLMGKNPLVGPNIKELGPRFPDMTHAYNPEMMKQIQSAANDMNYNLKCGIYAGVLGPTYETPAEVRMLKAMGADMVGMSTVPESIAANHLGLKVSGISCITNMAAGIQKVKLNHDEVKDTALSVMDVFTELLSRSIAKLGDKCGN